jgi:phage terminase small subunit
VAELQAQAAETEAKALEIACERLAVTKERVLAELACVAFSDIRKAVMWSGTEVEVIDSGLIDEDTAAAVAEVSCRNGSVRVRLHDKLSALVNLAKLLGLFHPSVAVTGRLAVEEADSNARAILLEKIDTISKRLEATDQV